MLSIQANVGRPKTSPLTRKEQLAAAQQRKREQDKKDGLKPLNVNVSQEAKGFADALCQIHKLTQRELIERLLEAAIKQGTLRVG